MVEEIIYLLRQVVLAVFYPFHDKLFFSIFSTCHHYICGGGVVFFATGSVDNNVIEARLGKIIFLRLFVFHRYLNVCVASVFYTMVVGYCFSSTTISFLRMIIRFGREFVPPLERRECDFSIQEELSFYMFEYENGPKTL